MKTTGTTLLLLLMLLSACESEPARDYGDSACPAAACREYGVCTNGFYGCTIGSDADCYQSQSCIKQGYCSFDDGACVLDMPIP